MAGSTRRKIYLEIAVVVLLILGAFIIISSLGGFKSPSKTRHVLFQVNASGGYALVTLKTPQGTDPSGTIVTTPWRTQITLPRGSEVYLTAANPSQTGELECSISLDNHEWKSMDKISPKNGVACAGIIP